MPAFRAGLLVSAALAVWATAMPPTVSYAQDELREKGNRACSGDARRLCKDSLADGDGAVLSCFQKHKTRLSGSCKKFLIDVGQLN